MAGYAEEYRLVCKDTPDALSHHINGLRRHGWKPHLNHTQTVLHDVEHHDYPWTVHHYCQMLKRYIFTKKEDKA